MGTERHTERRILVTPLRHSPTGIIRVLSARQLPTDHDYDGEPLGSIRGYQGDQPSSTAASVLVWMVLHNRRQKGRQQKKRCHS